MTDKYQVAVENESSREAMELANDIHEEYSHFVSCVCVWLGSEMSAFSEPINHDENGRKPMR